jgi:hypothetical protein
LHNPTSKTTDSASSASGTPTTSKSTPTKTASSSPPTHTSSTPSGGTTSSASNEAASKAIPLVVLNNTTTTHLAADAADLFRGAGWTITSTSNYSNNIASTCAYYDPNVSGAEAAAQLLQSEFPSIVRVKPKFSGLVAGPIVVILTSDFKTA